MIYKVWTRPQALKETAALPGHVRQRVKRAISDLAANPRPPESQDMGTPADVLGEGYEARRLRLDRWRVVYLVDHDNEWVYVLAVRRRPPYDYADLVELIREVLG